jgi:L-fucose mutarotase/ribose pyranase (RbsD/FucU family)
MPEKLKSQWSVQPEFQNAVSYRKIHISQIVEAMRLKFYEHAHKVISINFGIHSTAQFIP